jgi:hypothetical protein
LLCDQVQVNGPEADAIWVWLKEQRPAAGLEGFLGNDIKWNFVRAGLVSSTSSTNSSCLPPHYEIVVVIIGYRAQAKFLLVDGRPVERSAPTVQCWLSADASATAAPAFAVGMPELTAFRLLVSADMLRQQVRNQSRPTSSNIWSRLIKPAWRWRKGATIRDCRDR